MRSSITYWLYFDTFDQNGLNLGSFQAPIIIFECRLHFLTPIVFSKMLRLVLLALRNVCCGIVAMMVLLLLVVMTVAYRWLDYFITHF